MFFSGYDNKDKAMKTICLLIPVVIFFGCTGIYKGLNYVKYGVFTTNDRTSGSFAKLTGDMIRVKDEDDVNINQWVSRNKYIKILEACPSLTEYENEFLADYDFWASGNSDGNLIGDQCVWAFRRGMSDIGMYADAVTAEKFCEKVDYELREAVDCGYLEFDDAIHFTSQSRGIYTYEITGFVGETFKNIWDVIIAKGVFTAGVESTGDENDVRFMETITGVSIIRSEDDANRSFTSRIIRLSNRIMGIYRVMAKILTPLSVLGFAITCIMFCRHRTWEKFEPVIILFGLALSIFIYEFGVTVFNSWLGSIWFYSIGMLPLAQCFMVLGVGYIMKLEQRKRLP